MICSQLVQNAEGQAIEKHKGGGWVLAKDRRVRLRSRGGIRGKIDREVTDMGWWERGPQMISGSGCVAP